MKRNTVCLLPSCLMAHPPGQHQVGTLYRLKETTQSLREIDQLIQELSHLKNTKEHHHRSLQVALTQQQGQPQEALPQTDLDLHQVASMIGKPYHYVWRLITRGEIPEDLYYKLGRSYRVTPEGLQHLRQHGTQQPVPKPMVSFTPNRKKKRN